MIRSSVENPMEQPFDADATVAALQAGNMDALADLYNNCAPQIHRQLMGLTQGNEALAEDLTQDTICKAWRAINTYEPGRLDGWLHRIARNTFLDYARRGQRIRFDDLEAARITPVSGEPFDEILTKRTELGSYVSKIISMMDPDTAQTLLAVDGWGESYAEVAAAYNIPVGTVRSRVHRGRKAFWENPEHGYQKHARRQHGSTLVQNTDSAGSDERHDDE